MYFQPRSTFLAGAVALALMSSAALAQSPQPSVAAPPAATATTTTPPAKWMTQEATGQWRASKMLGLYVYNSDNEKIGDIGELIVDRTGKIEAVVVSAGGFLGIGEHDVAVPYGQISWVFTQVGPVRASSSTSPATTGAALPASQTYAYPNHAVLNMTKEELKAAPAFKFSR